VSLVLDGSRADGAPAPGAAAGADGSALPSAENIAAVAQALAPTPSAPAVPAENEFTLPLGMIDVVVNFLTRLALFTAEHKVGEGFLENLIIDQTCVFFFKFSCAWVHSFWISCLRIDRDILHVLIRCQSPFL